MRESAHTAIRFLFNLRLHLEYLRLLFDIALVKFHLFHPQFLVFPFKEADTVRLLGILYGEAKCNRDQARDRKPLCKKRVHVILSDSEVLAAGRHTHSTP